MIRRIKVIPFLLIFILIFMMVPGTAAEERISREELSVETVSTEAEDEKLFRFNAYYSDNGSIGIAMEIVKQEIIDRGEIHLAVTLPDSKIPIYNDVLPEEMFGSAIQNIELGKEYNVFITQTLLDTQYIYRGIIEVCDEGGALGCKSDLIEEQQQTMDSILDTLEAVRMEQDSSAKIKRIDITEAPAVFQETASTRATRYESESNNSRILANRIYDDDTIYGRITPSGDEDWYVISFEEYGKANFWLGDIPSGKDYDFELYDYNGGFIRGSYGTTAQEQIYNQTVKPFSQYYLRVYPSGSVNHSTSYYRVRAKNYVVATPLFPYSYIGGFSAIKYYLHDTTYAKPINDALYNWQSPPASVGTNIISPIAKTTTQSQARIEFKTYSSIDDINGITHVYMNTNKVLANSSNWNRGIIYLNQDKIKSDLSMARGVAAHEIGHMWGLAHNNSNPYSIMCDELNGRQVISISKTDNDAFNRKYN